MASESIDLSALGLMGYSDSEPIRARGIIVKKLLLSLSISITLNWMKHFLTLNTLAVNNCVLVGGDLKSLFKRGVINLIDFSVCNDVYVFCNDLRALLTFEGLKS